MHLRKARTEDAASLTALAREAKASWGYPEAWLRAWERELQITAEYIRANTVWVAQSEGGPVGVLGVSEGPDGPEIDHLWIAPRAQRCGIGRRLVDEAVRLGRRAGWRSLRIVSDPFAQPFYERLGAVRVGTLDAPVQGTPRTLPVLRLDL